MNTIDDSWVQAYWYACGYNDFRLTGEPYIDAQAFATYWLEVTQRPNRPSMQSAFMLFTALVVDDEEAKYDDGYDPSQPNEF